MDVRSFLNGLAVFALAYFVLGFLFLAANSTVFVSITADREEAKAILLESGAYEKAGPLLRDYLAGQEEAQNLPLDQPAVRQTFDESLNGKVIQNAVEPAVDDVYAWLETGEGEPSFNINLKPAKDRLADNISNLAADRLAKLPACSFEQLLELRSSQIDPFSLPCAPPGTDKGTVKDQINGALYHEELGIFAGQNIKFDDFGQAETEGVADAVKNAPEAFQSASRTPWLAAVLGLLAAIGLVFVAPTRSKGATYLGITLLITALVLAVAPYTVNLLLEGAMEGSEPTFTSDILLPVLKIFNARAASIYFTFGGISLIAGTIALIVGRRLKAEEK